MNIFFFLHLWIRAFHCSFPAGLFRHDQNGWWSHNSIATSASDWWKLNRRHGEVNLGPPCRFARFAISLKNIYSMKNINLWFVHDIIYRFPRLLIDGRFCCFWIQMSVTLFHKKEKYNLTWNFQVLRIKVDFRKRSHWSWAVKVNYQSNRKFRVSKTR